MKVIVAKTIVHNQRVVSLKATVKRIEAFQKRVENLPYLDVVTEYYELETLVKKFTRDQLTLDELLEHGP